MSNKNKVPVDAYSREEFQGGLDVLEKSGITYESRSEQRAQNKDWQLAHDAATSEEHSAIEKLDRLYANARREASDEHVTRELLPRIEKIKKDTEETLRQIGDNPPSAVASLGSAIINEANEADRIIKKEHHGRLGEVIVEIFIRVRELYQRFKEFVGSFFASDRYGNGKGSNTGTTK